MYKYIGVSTLYAYHLVLWRYFAIMISFWYISNSHHSPTIYLSTRNKLPSSQDSWHGASVIGAHLMQIEADKILEIWNQFTYSHSNRKEYKVQGYIGGKKIISTY